MDAEQRVGAQAQAALPAAPWQDWWAGQGAALRVEQGPAAAVQTTSSPPAPQVVPGVHWAPHTPLETLSATEDSVTELW